MSNRRASPPSAEADATTDGPDLERRLAACYESLPNSERPVADLLLNFPAQLATHSATKLALLAGASKAAVSRLIQRLGYPSYAAARAAVRNRAAVSTIRSPWTTTTTCTTPSSSPTSA